MRDQRLAFSEVHIAAVLLGGDLCAAGWRLRADQVILLRGR